MKKIILSLSFLLTLAAYAQTATSIQGPWSFDKINEAVLTTDEEKAAAPILATMFASFQISFDGDLYDLQMLTSQESGAYTFANKVVTLKDGSKITFLNDESGLVEAGGASFYIKPGVYVKEEVVLKYLTQNNYDNIAVNTDLLLGKWKIEEIRLLEEDEEAAMMMGIIKMMSFDFREGGVFKLEVMGMGEETIWQQGEEKGQLLASMDGQNNSSFYVKQLTKDSLILELTEKSTLLYLTRVNP